MAHHHECRAVRGRGDGDGRGARALSRAALLTLALIAGPSHAGDQIPRAELVESSLSDPAAWWGEFGRPGWVADLWLDGEAPWVVAGHARGGLRLDEPGRAPRILVDPAAQGSFTPLTWYDSLGVVVGGGGARQGFDGALVTLEGRTGGAGPAGAEAVADLRSGDFGWDENSLMISRCDSLSWLRGEAYGLNRTPAGFLETAGRHLWGVSGGLRRGAHSLEAAFAQQGVAGSLLSTEEESNKGRAGGVTYRYEARAGAVEIDYGRGRARTESFSNYFDVSIRDEASTALSARIRHRSGASASFTWQNQHVVRSESDEFDARAHSTWGVVGWSRAAGGGTLQAELGAGRHSALGKTTFAPSLTYEVKAGGVTARTGAERVLHAVWSDVAFDATPFLQRTWAGVLELSVGASRRRRARVTFLGGRTQSRAILTRTPLSDYALRLGATPDPEPYGFGLTSLEVRGEWRRLFATGSGFVLARGTSTAQSQVDPGLGGRAVVGTRFRVFQGDLGIEVYGGAEGVGARESEEGFGPRLPGYATSTVGALLTLGEVTVTIRARNLENELHEEPWLDYESGLVALGPGREIRFALTATLHD